MAFPIRLNHIYPTLVTSYIREQDQPLNDSPVVEEKSLANKLRNVTQILRVYHIKKQIGNTKFSVYPIIAP